MTHALDAGLDLVADWHRRVVLDHLRQQADGTVRVADLVEEAYRRGNPEDGSPRSREAIAIQLEHTHLPKLADAGVVKYERRSGLVRYESNEQVEALLDSLPGENPVAVL